MVAIIKFKSEARPDGKVIDWVLLGPRGESLAGSQTWHRVSKLIPPENGAEESQTYQAMKGRWEQIGPKYEAWKRNEEIPDDGTPIGAWSGVTSEQAEIFKSRNLRTIEDVANMSDDTIQKLPIPGARKFKELAKQYLEGRPAAEAEQALADANERIAAMEEMLAEMTAPKKAKGKAAA